MPRVSTDHLDYLDGFRALAAGFVVIHHAWLFGFSMRAHDGWLGLATNWLLYGHLAVDAFIVLSGFCLALPLASGTGSVEIGAFYRRRARRILPPYFAILLICLASVWLRAAVNPAGVRFESDVAVANLLMLQDVFPQRVLLVDAPLWSVAVELKIYLLFPLLIWLALRYGQRVLLGTAALLAAAATLTALSLQPLREWAHSCPWYILLFATGCAASLTALSPRAFPRGWVRGIFAAALLALAVLLFRYPIGAGGEIDEFSPHLVWIDTAAGVAVAAALALLGHAARGGRRHAVLQILRWRPLVFGGSFAYSIYLVHYPVLFYLETVVKRLGFAKSFGGGVTLLLLGVPLAIGLAYLFFLAFEKPFLRGNARRRALQAAPRGAAMASAQARA